MALSGSNGPSVVVLLGVCRVRFVSVVRGRFGFRAEDLLWDCGVCPHILKVNNGLAHDT